MGRVFGGFSMAFGYDYKVPEHRSRKARSQARRRFDEVINIREIDSEWKDLAFGISDNIASTVGCVWSLDVSQTISRNVQEVLNGENLDLKYRFESAELESQSDSFHKVPETPLA
jgi:hypothetical protein